MRWNMQSLHGFICIMYSTAYAEDKEIILKVAINMKSFRYVCNNIFIAMYQL